MSLLRKIPAGNFFHNPSRAATTFAALLIYGCITAAGPDKSQNTDKLTSPPQTAQAKTKDQGRVGVNWQEQMLKDLAALPSGSEAFGLFSEGGWSNEGQIMIYVTKGKPAEVAIIAPNKQAITTQRLLSDSEWQKISAETAKAKNLENIDMEAFDALTFEYVHAVKDTDKVSVTKRVFIKNPGIKEAPEHDRLIATFQAVRKKN